MEQHTIVATELGGRRVEIHPERVKFDISDDNKIDLIIGSGPGVQELADLIYGAGIGNLSLSVDEYTIPSFYYTNIEIHCPTAAVHIQGHIVEPVTTSC